MVKQIGKRTAIVSIKELGTKCWLPKRFVTGGGRCERIFTCSYPEKKNCQAVRAEIDYLRQEQMRLINSSAKVGHTIELLSKMLEK